MRARRALLLGSVLALVVAAAQPAAAVGISPQGRVSIEGVIDLVDPAADPNSLGIEVGDPFSIEAIYNAAPDETLTHRQSSACMTYSTEVVEIRGVRRRAERPPQSLARAAAWLRWSSGRSAKVELQLHLGTEGDPDDRGEIGIGRARGEGRLRVVAEAVLQVLMEADVEALIGAGRHERSPERRRPHSGRAIGRSLPCRPVATSTSSCASTAAPPSASATASPA